MLLLFMYNCLSEYGKAASNFIHVCLNIFIYTSSFIFLEIHLNSLSIAFRPKKKNITIKIMNLDTHKIITLLQ